MSILDRPLPGTTRDPLYPDTDGFSMVESDLHYIAMKHLHGALTYWYRGRDDVYVAANMFLYYEEGVPTKNRGPDIMVAKGVRGKHPRRSFRTWEEGVVPAVIIEVTSKSTQREDDLVKPRVYADIGVKEYFLFDPFGEYLETRLRGYYLVDEDYDVLAADESGAIYSPELGLRLVPQDELLRLVDPATDKPLPTEEEYAEELEEAIRRREQARLAADQAKSEADQAKSEADQAKSEADQAKSEAEQAKTEADQAKAEVDHAKSEAEQAKAEADQAKAEADQAKAEADQAKAEAKAERQRVAELEAELSRLRASSDRKDR